MNGELAQLNDLLTVLSGHDAVLMRFRASLSGHGAVFMRFREVLIGHGAVLMRFRAVLMPLLLVADELLAVPGRRAALLCAC